MTSQTSRRCTGSIITTKFNRHLHPSYLNLFHNFNPNSLRTQHTYCTPFWSATSRGKVVYLCARRNVLTPLSTLKIEAVRSSEMWVTFHWTTWRHVTESWTCYPCCGLRLMMLHNLMALQTFWRSSNLCSIRISCIMNRKITMWILHAVKFLNLIGL
jgi:hypothetical protein